MPTVDTTGTLNDSPAELAAESRYRAKGLTSRRLKELLTARLESERGETIDSRFQVLARRWGVSKRKVYQLNKEALRPPVVGLVDIAYFDPVNIAAIVEQDCSFFWSFVMELRSVLSTEQFMKVCVCPQSAVGQIFGLAATMEIGDLSERKKAREELVSGLSRVPVPRRTDSQFVRSKQNFSTALILALQSKYVQARFELRLWEIENRLIEYPFETLLIAVEVAEGSARELKNILKSPGR